MATKTSASNEPQSLSSNKTTRPNYNALHAQPLPVKVYPLPPLIPHNPLSILYIAAAFVRQAFFPPSSHAESQFIGYFSSETRSIHVTDPATVRALWEHGFFGKGSLSRSEPTWLDREKRRLGLLVGETSEEITRRRREERKAFKQERARKQREEIEDKIKAEAGAAATSSYEASNELEKALHASEDGPPPPDSTPLAANGPVVSHSTPLPLQTTGSNGTVDTEPQQVVGSESSGVMNDKVAIANMEHLQLDLNEAFFLCYALGVLTILSPHTKAPIPRDELLPLFLRHAVFPPSPKGVFPQPDNKFIVHYAAYHHFRSLGWVARPGIKFGVDLMLYNRGPVFSHAEFAVVILPSYSHVYWKQDEGKAYLSKTKQRKEWHWLQMVSRVQSQVRKTLVLCFVEIPPPWGSSLMTDEKVGDIGEVLRRYEVREVVLRRWVPNRTRD